MSTPTSDRPLGGFSCDATSYSGNATYYQPAAIFPIGSLLLPPEGLGPSYNKSYYVPVTPSPLGPRMPTPAPNQFPVPLPTLGLTNSKAFSVGKYGSCATPTSAQVGYAVSAVQYGVGASYYVPT